MIRPFWLYHDFEHVTLTVTFDLLLKNFTISRSFLILRDRAFVFGMCVPCDKAFQIVPKNFHLWPWPLTYFWTLAILSYCKRLGVHVWHMCSLCPYLPNGTIDFKHVTLTVNFDLLFMPPFEKGGTYCVAHVGPSVGPSVGRYVGLP